MGHVGEFVLIRGAVPLPFVELAFEDAATAVDFLDRQLQGMEDRPFLVLGAAVQAVQDADAELGGRDWRRGPMRLELIPGRHQADDHGSRHGKYTQENAGPAGPPHLAADGRRDVRCSRGRTVQLGFALQPPQGFGDDAGSGGSLLGSFLEQSLQQPSHRRRNLEGTVAYHGDPAPDDFLQQRQGLVVSAQRRLTGQHLVQHATQAVQVGPTIDGLAHALLGHHVNRRAQHLSSQRQLGRIILPAGDTEVDQLDAVHPAVAGLQPDVGRFDVAVDQAMLVGHGQALRNLCGHVQGLAQGQPAVLPQPLGEGHPFQALHGDEGNAVHLADLEDGDDVLVGNAGEELGLAEKACPQVVAGDFGPEHLESDRAAEPGILGVEDNGHAAGAEDAENAKGVDPAQLAGRARRGQKWVAFAFAGLAGKPAPAPDAIAQMLAHLLGRNRRQTVGQQVIELLRIGTGNGRIHGYSRVTSGKASGGRQPLVVSDRGTSAPCCSPTGG